VADRVVAGSEPPEVRFDPGDVPRGEVVRRNRRLDAIHAGSTARSETTDAESDQPFCASCGARVDGMQRRRRRGNPSLTGLLLVVVGGARLFVPFWPSSGGRLSI
jgi:hypothetical protein